MNHRAQWPCNEHDSAVWDAYAKKVPESSRLIAEELFGRLCEAIQARGLPWTAGRDGDTIGFRAPGDATFKVAINIGQRQGVPTREFRAPSLLIHPYARLEDLGEQDPYPDFGPFWYAETAAQGWNIATQWRIPDVGPAIELAAKYGRT